MTLSCAKIQHHKDDTCFSQKQVEPGLNIPEGPRKGVREGGASRERGERRRRGEREREE